jgi:cell division transport system permease protein
MRYAVREALAAFRRAPLLTGLSAGMIALSLFVVGLFGLAAFNVRHVVQAVESRVEVVAYLRDDADPGSLEIAQAQIREYPEVSAVRYVSRDEALATAKKELQEFEEVFGTLERNPLPASLEISLKPGMANAEVVRDVARRIELYTFVEDVRFGNDWLDKVFTLRRAAGTATLLLGIGFALVAALIIGAAVRMSVYARRDEITIMRLVGATDAFVRRPFVLEGVMTGFGGAILAVIGTRAIYKLFTGRVFELEWLPAEWLAAGVASGALLGLVAAMIAVRRHLREIA